MQRRIAMPNAPIIFNGSSKVTGESSSFPYKIRKLDEKTNQELLKYFTGERTGFVQVGPKDYFFPCKYEREASNFYNFKARKDDVWIVTFPRSGTTWTQEMVWLLSNELDYEQAKSVPLTERFPFLEFSIFVHDEVKAEFLKENSYSDTKMQLIEEIAKPAWKALDDTVGKRFIKTHLPFSLLPPNLLDIGCKVIYIARNPKDVAVSFYHLNRLIRTQGYLGDFPRYWDYFEKNLQPWTPYWSHIQEGWECRDNDNLLFLFYEDINKNLRESINRVSTFLNVKLDEDELDGLVDHLKIENFRKNKSVNYDVLEELGILKKGEQGFVRKGKIEGWREYFKGELNERADKWIQDHIEKIGIRFPK